MEPLPFYLPLVPVERIELSWAFATTFLALSLLPNSGIPASGGPCGIRTHIVSNVGVFKTPVSRQLHQGANLHYLIFKEHIKPKTPFYSERGYKATASSKSVTPRSLLGTRVTYSNWMITVSFIFPYSLYMIQHPS